MSKQSIQTITVKSLIRFLLILSLVVLVISGLNFRALSITAVENKATALADVIQSGLTSHMKAGIMDKRDFFLEEIRQTQHINQLTIVRGPDVIAQFGDGSALEKPLDNVTRQVFETRRPVYLLNEFSLQPVMRVVIPYTASSELGLNCLNCHQVEEGTVLGAVDMEINISGYRNMSALVLVGLFLMAMLFLILITLNTAHIMQRHVKSPLETLIALAKRAYHSRQPVDSNRFDSLEFTHVADEINQFNSEVIAHQNLLKEKNQQLLELNDEIESTLRETVHTIGLIEAQRSQETNFHTKRVSLYCHFLAKQIGLSDEDADLVMAAAPLHDIGKLGIPDSILNKPGKLTPEERQVMEQHPKIGYAMLRHSNRDVLKAGAYIALYHHEKWDGSGYPQGLKGDGIHLFGRIVALADVFDALYSSRVYKASWDLPAITALFREERGNHFDPQLVDIFLTHTDKFVAIYNRYNAETKETDWEIDDLIAPSGA